MRVDLRHLPSVSPNESQEVSHGTTLSHLPERVDRPHPQRVDLPPVRTQQDRPEVSDLSPWTIGRVISPTYDHAWNDVFREGTLLTHCPECEHECATLSDPDEIAEIERQRLAP